MTMAANPYSINNGSLVDNHIDTVENHIYDNTNINSTEVYTENTTAPSIYIDNYRDIDDYYDMLRSEHEDLMKTAEGFFLYFTPIIIVIGIIGNSLSVAVFCSKSMRKLSASTYLAALAIADICTLVFYVLIEWLRRGDFTSLSFMNKNGFCQVLLYLAYVSRLMSSWIIVVFTVERFTGVCYPLKSFRKGAKKIILIMLLISFLLTLYKPIMLKEHHIGHVTKCGVAASLGFVSFVLDFIFAVFLTLVPFLVITTLNILIVRKLFIRNMRSSDDTQIRLEFTMILFAISFFFVAFNAPYFVIWSKYFFLTNSPLTNRSISDMDYWKGVLSIVKTIFFLNYCINFFLYSITGAYFRRELFDLLTFRSYRSLRRRDTRSYIRCSRFGSSRTQMTSTNNSVCVTSTT